MIFLISSADRYVVSADTGIQEEHLGKVLQKLLISAAKGVVGWNSHLTYYVGKHINIIFINENHFKYLVKIFFTTILRKCVTYAST